MAAWSHPALSPDSPTVYVPVATDFVPVLPGATPVTGDELELGPSMSRFTFGASSTPPPVHTLSMRSVPVSRVLVIVHTTWSVGSTMKFDGPNGAPVPLRTHDAAVWVQPASRLVSVAEYVPVTTVFAVVVPPARPVTVVVDADGPTIFRSTVGCSPDAPPTHVLSTRTVPVWRVFVNVQTIVSPGPTVKLDGPNELPAPSRTHEASVWVQPATRLLSVAEYVPVTTVFGPVVPGARPVTVVVDADGPTMFRATVGASPAAPPTHVFFTVTVAMLRVLVSVQTTFSPLAIGNPVCASYVNAGLVPFWQVRLV